jgi:hypothetical protein
LGVAISLKLGHCPTGFVLIARTTFFFHVSRLLRGLHSLSGGIDTLLNVVLTTVKQTLFNL